MFDVNILHATAACGSAMIIAGSFATGYHRVPAPTVPRTKLDQLAAQRRQERLQEAEDAASASPN